MLTRSNRFSVRLQALVDRVVLACPDVPVGPDPPGRSRSGLKVRTREDPPSVEGGTVWGRAKSTQVGCSGQSSRGHGGLSKRRERSTGGVRVGLSPAPGRGAAPRSPAGHGTTMSTEALIVAVALSAVVSGALGAPASPPAPEPAAPSSARAVWPLDPRPAVVARFDPPDEQWSAGHRGVDLLGSPGQPVRAALEGTISFAGTIAGRGVVVVDHGGVRTSYEPVSASVRRGLTVTTGSTVGTLQGVPGHCAPRTCLHWGLRRGAEYLDPLSLLGQAPVVLLPSE